MTDEPVWIGGPAYKLIMGRSAIFKMADTIWSICMLVGGGGGRPPFTKFSTPDFTTLSFDRAWFTEWKGNNGIVSSVQADLSLPRFCMKHSASLEWTQCDEWCQCFLIIPKQAFAWYSFSHLCVGPVLPPQQVAISSPTSQRLLVSWQVRFNLFELDQKISGSFHFGCALYRSQPRRECVEGKKFGGFKTCTHAFTQVPGEQVSLHLFIILENLFPSHIAIKSERVHINGDKQKGQYHVNQQVGKNAITYTF